MNYIELTLLINNSNGFETDVVIDSLATVGFESFVSTLDGIKAYCAASTFNKIDLVAWKKTLSFDIQVDYSVKEIEDRDWNEEWEKNYFTPIVIDNQCIVHSSFHKDIPKATYDILIDPKMAFGTGHHETTELMMEELLQLDISGKSLLDMGCGTGILAILACMKGASAITAIDIDKWAFDNTKENCTLNNCPTINVEMGDAELLTGRRFDVILANINRNSLLNDMHIYACCLQKDGIVMMSGFYMTDIPAIEEEAKKHNLLLTCFKEKNNWVVTLFNKL